MSEMNVLSDEEFANELDRARKLLRGKDAIGHSRGMVKRWFFRYIRELKGDVLFTGKQAADMFQALTDLLDSMEAKEDTLLPGKLRESHPDYK
jgi:hypothetical protein